MVAGKLKTRKPILGDWELCECLGRRCDYLLYRARHRSSLKEAHLRVLPGTADAEARKSFTHAVTLASENPEYFLPVTSICSRGGGLVAVSEIPDRTLASAALHPSIGQLVTLCRGLAGGLGLVHRIGRIHAYLVPESVEVVGQGTTDIRLRLLDMGRGLPVGCDCLIEVDSELPPEVSEDKVANVSWDIYAFGRLGQYLLRQANASGAAEGIRLALEALLQACSSAREQRRPRSMQIISDRLCDIVQEIGALAPEEPSAASRIGLRKDSARDDDHHAAPHGRAIEAARWVGMSQSSRIIASLLSVVAVAAIGLALASLIGISVLII